MMKLKAFGSICILAFVLFATVSAANNTTTTAPPPSAATTSLSSLPATTAAPPPSATTTAPAPSATTTTPPPSATTTAPPTTPEPSKDEVVTTKQSRIDCKARITSVEFEDVKDLTSENGTKFKKEFEEKMLGVFKKNKLVISVKVTGVSPGSVIVEYYLVLNTTSEAEAAKIANAVTEAIKSGKIGNYTTDQNFETDAYIIRKVKASDVSTAPTSTTTTVSTALLIVLGAALFILLVIIIILIVLVVFLLKLKEKREKQ